MGSGTELTERKIRSILTILVLGCYEKEEAATKGVARWNGIIWMKKADGQDEQTKKKDQIYRPVSKDDIFLQKRPKIRRSECEGKIGRPAETR